MTKLLYMNDIEGNYIKEFDAKVIKKKDNYIVLDQSAFYPLGGGQPSDTGIIREVVSDEWIISEAHARSGSSPEPTGSPYLDKAR